jgi:hypothetical protein
MTYEKSLEQKCVRKLLSYDCFVIKLRDLAQNGAPDRMIVTKQGYIFFLEFKTEKGELSPKQVHYIKQLKHHRQKVVVIDNYNSFLLFIEAIKGWL